MQAATVHQINQVALWKRMHGDELLVKQFPPNYPYVDKDGKILRSKVSMFRYAKNYTRGKGLRKTQFSLCFFSNEDDTKKVEKFLDGVAKDIKLPKGKVEFQKLEVYYEG